MKVNKYCGEVAIVGHPNVGKSSLLNTLLKRKTAIVCNKPQTTRDQIKGIFDNENMQVIFIDTPGYHEPHNELDKHLNAQARHSLKQANAVILVIDTQKGFNEEDELVIKKLNEYKVENVIIALNKVDITNSKKIQEIKELLINEYGFKNIFEICANDFCTLSDLINCLQQYLEFTEPMYDSNNLNDLIDDDFLISEIIREQCLEQLRMEIPYGIAVIIDSKRYDPKTNRLTIDATIVCEKESQKKIIIGANGIKIRDIGTKARKQLLNIFDCSIMLRLFVKFDKDWRNSKLGIKKYGYGS